MSTIQDVFQQAQLAEAAYADFWDSEFSSTITNREDVRAALVAEGFSSSQATTFDDLWRVVDHLPDTDGFSATFFESLDHPGQYTLAMRGSLGVFDFAVADISLATGSSAFHQVLSMVNYVLRLQAGSNGQTRQVELGWEGNGLSLTSGFVAGVGPGIAPSQMTVTGHSLGGFLAQVYQRTFASEAVCTYNSLGVISTNAALFGQLTDLLGLPAGNFSSGAGDNIVVPGDPAQIVGTVQGNPQQEIYSEGANQFPVDAHRIGAMTDALALYNLFATLNPALNDAGAAGIRTITDILKAASNTANRSLETILDALRTLFEQNYAGANSHLNAAPTATNSRQAFYANLNTLQTWFENPPSTAFNLTNLAGQDAATLNSAAQTDLATRYALYKLNPFVVSGAGALYGQINADRGLDLYDPENRTGSLTDPWIEDRAAMLEVLMKRNTQDTNFAPYPADTIYSDATRRILLRPENSGHVGDAIQKQIRFGSAQGQSLQGGSRADHLYGMGGADYLEGKGDDAARTRRCVKSKRRGGKIWISKMTSWIQWFAARTDTSIDAAPSAGSVHWC